MSEPALHERIAQSIRDGDVELPPLPALLGKVQEVLAADNADASKIAELVRTDPAIAGALLRAANSALFGGLSPISDVAQSIARLGLNRVQSIVIGLAVHGEVFAGDKLQQLWNHAVASAAGARRLAEREGSDPDQAFIAGLLHGIGRTLVLRRLDELVVEQPELQLTDSVKEEIVASLQGEIGYATLESWNLPDDICAAARFDDDLEDFEANLLVRIVRAADRIACKLGMHPRPDPELSLLDDDAIEGLELRDIEVAALMVHVEDDIDAIRSMI